MDRVITKTKLDNKYEEKINLENMEEILVSSSSPIKSWLFKWDLQNFKKYQKIL